MRRGGQAPPRRSLSVMGRDQRTSLLVDDEPGIAQPLASALEREGFATTTVGRAADALPAAERLSPDLVLLDLGLPDGSGFDVCRELRSRSQTPVIMLTAKIGRASCRERTQRAGATGA